MPLTLVTESANPYVRYSSEMDVWSHSTDDPAIMHDIEMVDGALPAPIIIDVENIEMGWLLLGQGVRDWQPFPALDKPLDKPDGDYKQGFAVKMYSTKLFGDSPLREMSANGKGLMIFIQNLYNEAEPKFGKGEVPAVKIKATPRQKLGKGNTRIVNYEIVKWVDRPADMVSDAPSVESTEQQPTTAPAASGDTFDDDEV